MKCSSCLVSMADYGDGVLSCPHCGRRGASGGPVSIVSDVPKKKVSRVGLAVKSPDKPARTPRRKVSDALAKVSTKAGGGTRKSESKSLHVPSGKSQKSPGSK